MKAQSNLADFQEVLLLLSCTRKYQHTSVFCDSFMELEFIKIMLGGTLIVLVCLPVNQLYSLTSIVILFFKSLDYKINFFHVFKIISIVRVNYLLNSIQNILLNWTIPRNDCHVKHQYPAFT